MRYGSVCSGIEAATVAWEPLGWKAAWFAEIEKFPAAVLAARWPDVANLGDMTKIAAAVRAGTVEAPDILVGGTPCQAFSIAGLRNGLDDARGQLTLSYVELADAIDDKRRDCGEEEAVIVWENVPGVLSSKDNAFGYFIGALAGEDSELQPAGGKWSNAGCVFGSSRIVAWRVLDAQFFGVAQRRRRVFVVASARSGFDPAKVLFELDSLRRDTPPSREPQAAVTADAGKRAEIGSHWDNPVNPHPTLNQSNNEGGIGQSNQEIFSQRGCGLVGDMQLPDVVGSIAAHSFTGGAGGRPEGAAASHFIPVAFGGGNTSGSIEVASACTAHGVRMDFDTETFAVSFAENSRGEIRMQNGDGQITGPLSTGGGKPGQGYPAIALSVALRGRDGGATAELGGEIAGTLRSSGGGGDKAHVLAPAIAIAGNTIGRSPDNGGNGTGYSEEIGYTLTKTDQHGVAFGMQVRRLTPRECERLQGFPDDHTLIAWRGKDAVDCPDGPRYKAIGNSMAVPVMRWIGERIAAALPVEQPAPRIYQRPFLKWAGGKYSLLPELDRLIPAGKRLIEPFVGGGSVFINSDKHENFLLADVNADLINLYQMLTVVPDLVTEWAKGLFEKLNDLDGFIACREEFNEQKMSGPERAAAFLYLNRHCFNGLIRYNSNGDFNVGWGKKPNPYFPEKELLAFSAISKKCVFMNAGYRRTLALAGEGDVVYCDPPYDPLPGTAGFTNYAAGGFTWDDQQELARCCVAAHQRGARVVISNSTAPRIIELYKRHGFNLHHVSARRAISSKGSTRETATDIVAIL